MYDVAKMKIVGPYAVGAKKVEKLTAKLRSSGKVGETKADRAYRQLELMVEFRRTWSAAKWGELDHVLAILALAPNARFGFDPKTGTRALFMKLVLHPDRRRAHLWGQVLEAIETARFTVAHVREYGMTAIAARPPGRSSLEKFLTLQRNSKVIGISPSAPGNTAGVSPQKMLRRKLGTPE